MQLLETGDVLDIVLNRPDQRNVLSAAMSDTPRDAWVLHFIYKLLAGDTEANRRWTALHKIGFGQAAA